MTEGGECDYAVMDKRTAVAYNNYATEQRGGCC